MDLRSNSRKQGGMLPLSKNFNIEIEDLKDSC